MTDPPPRTGRPRIGNPIHVRLGHLGPDVDEWASAHLVSRAEAVRQLVALGLHADHSPTPTEET